MTTFYFLLLNFREKRLGISCEASARHTIHMKRQILFSLIIIIIIIIIKTITLKYHLLWLWLELYGFAGSCLIYSMNSSIRNVERVNGLFQGMSTYFSYKTRNRIYSKFTNTLTLPILLTCELWTCTGPGNAAWKPTHVQIDISSDPSGAE